MNTNMMDFDNHIEMLSDVDGNVFKITKAEISTFQLEPVFERIEKKIIGDDKNDTIIFIEQPSGRMEREIKKNLNRLGNKLDGKKDHKIHAFFIPVKMFSELTDNMIDWD